MRKSNWLLVSAVLSVLAVPVPVLAFNDTEIDDSPCTFISHGDVSGHVELTCPGLSKEAVENIEKLLQEQLTEQTRNLKQKNDHIDLLTDQIARLKQNREKALADNKQDQQKSPENPLLVEERKALEVFDLKKAAELREQYYQALKQEKQAKVAEMQSEMAREAFVSAERWEGAFDMAKALVLYQEAVGFKADYLEAWMMIISLAENLGNTQLALEAVGSLQEQLDPEKDMKWLSFVLDNEGDLFRAKGDNEAAINRYQQLLKLTMKLVEAEPDNTEWQHDLYVSKVKVGDMHLQTGDNVAALKAYEDGLAIAKKLADLDPNHTEWQRDLSVSHNKVGDMHLKTGDNVAALKAYEESLTIRKKLADLDPNHTEWQRDLYVSKVKVGDMHLQTGDNVAALKAYEDGLAIAKKLADLDPNHTEWKNDLSISYERVGDMYKSTGKSDAAMDAYQKKLDIDKALVAIDPKQAKWQRDLSVSYDRVGDMHNANGDGVSALKAYEDGLAIAKRLAELDPNVVEWQTDLVVSYYKLAQVQPDKAKQLLTDALTILKKLHAENKLDHEKQGWITFLESAIE
uniref:Tetratricopeptide repeat protein n=1 Tax=uncultured Thiotrichaceae bacterium TaxID=298394 RepID=A0A6S6UP81_9GAMM|nr:MAG: Unknown protein [uncultured Thiotrichaceae bacterium]